MAHARRRRAARFSVGTDYSTSSPFYICDDNVASSVRPAALLAPNPIQTNAIMSWVATPRAVARVRAAICQAAPIKKTYGINTDSGWVAYARRRQFARVMALRSALRAEGGAARRMLLFYSSFAVSAAR